MKQFNPQSIKNLRESKSLTQHQFAQALGGAFQAQHISGWEAGVTPSVKSIVAIMNTFGVTFDYFFQSNGKHSKTQKKGI